MPLVIAQSTRASIQLCQLKIRGNLPNCWPDMAIACAIPGNRPGGPQDAQTQEDTKEQAAERDEQAFPFQILPFYYWIGL